MKALTMRTLESAEPGGNLEVGASDEGFHIVDASGGDSVCLDEGQATGLLSVLTEALGVPADAEDAYVRGFDRGFAEGAARAEREVWEVLGAYIGPAAPLDTHARPLPADARETMTLAAALSTLLGSMVPRRPPSQWTRFEALERAVDDHVTSWISVGGPRLAEALATHRAVQGARLAFERPESMCVVMTRGFHQVEVMTPDEFCDRWREGYR